MFLFLLMLQEANVSPQPRTWDEVAMFMIISSMPVMLGYIANRSKRNGDRLKNLEKVVKGEVIETRLRDDRDRKGRGDPPLSNRDE